MEWRRRVLKICSSSKVISKRNQDPQAKNICPPCLQMTPNQISSRIRPSSVLYSLALSLHDIFAPSLYRGVQVLEYGGFHTFPSIFDVFCQRSDVRLMTRKPYQWEYSICSPLDWDPVSSRATLTSESLHPQSIVCNDCMMERSPVLHASTVQKQILAKEQHILFLMVTYN